jgi:hypothetical protein
MDVLQCSKATIMPSFAAFALTVALVGVLCLAWIGLGALMAG